MIYLGIDIAKLNHVASATDSDGQVLIHNLLIHLHALNLLCTSN